MFNALAQCISGSVIWYMCSLYTSGKRRSTFRMLETKQNMGSGLRRIKFWSPRSVPEQKQLCFWMQKRRVSSTFLQLLCSAAICCSMSRSSNTKWRGTPAVGTVVNTNFWARILNRVWILIKIFNSPHTPLEWAFCLFNICPHFI